ncbi:DNA translocase FtsK [Solibacillus silvestris]|uniref:DNA translocase FtsK n=1 Tax=Solibacillus silvestris TaxID=76853 RepID=UPI003F7DC6EF
MSWIKNKFNQFFKMDLNEEYDDYEEYTEAPEIEQPKQQQAQTGYYRETEQPKKAFRFPLIEDEHEEKGNEQAQPRQTTRFYDEDNEKLSLPNYLQKPVAHEIYDVEVSGIRDLLERRRKGKGHSNVIPKSETLRRLPITKEEREGLRKKPAREEKNVNKQAINPMENKKRFVPTDVPSPVHGFKKPTPIEQLIEKQQSLNEKLNDEEQQAPEIIEPQNTEILDQPIEPISKQPIENKQQKIVEQSTVKEQIVAVEGAPAAEPHIIPQEEENNSDKELILFEVEETAQEQEQEQTREATGDEQGEPPAVLLEEVDIAEEKQGTSIAETLNDVQVKHVTIENSTIHIGQLNVEQMPPADEGAVVEESIQEAKPLQQSNRGSRVPFNVVMLKSDKEKLLTKKFVEQQLDQQNSEHEEVTANETEAAEEIVEENEEILIQSVHAAGTAEDAQKSIVNEDRKIDQHAQQSFQNEVLQPGEEKSVTMAFQQTTKQYEPVNELQKEPTSDMYNTAIGLLERESIVSERLEEEMEVATTTEVQPQLISDEKNEQNGVGNTSIEEAASQLQSVEQDKQLLEVQQAEKKIPYVKPPLEYLVPPEEMIEDRDWMDEQGENLVEALSHFQIQAHIESIVQGPAVTQFEITVGQGTKVSKVRNLTDDIKLALAAKDIRIDAPIPGKRSIGIEIPNRISRSVRLSEVTDSESFRNSDSPLEAALGLDLTGKPVTIDLRKMPHGLIAGATGSGKSVCINSILVSLLYKANPNELKLMLIDPKMVELAPFNHIPHLVSPVITDVKAATAALKWAVEEMERRYQLFMHSGARKIEAYNKMCDANGMYAQKLPYLLIVIDELADLMMMSPQDVEDSIVRITQKARAAGIHLIVATQRPSVDVITGLIKSNIPTRIAFSVSSQIDSRTILDAQGAERLLGRGDMLYLGNGMSAPTRIQGTFVTDDEIEEIIEYVREQGEPQYIFKQEELLKRSEAAEDQDELFEEVCRFVYEQGSASTSLLQRRYHIGYNRAARLIDMLERQGYVSEPKGSKPRDVFITEEDLMIQFGD